MANLFAAVPLMSPGRTRWIARLLGLLLAVFFMAMGILGSIGEPLTLTGAVLGVLLVWAIVSMVLAWRWERLGGLSGVLAGVALGIFTAITAGRHKASVALLMGLPVVVLGAAFLVASRRTSMPSREGSG